MLLGLLYLWMLTVPFPLAVAYGWASPAISMLLGIALFGINSIGAELEDPFGDQTNDLPLDVYEGAAQQASVANKLGWPPTAPTPDAAQIVMTPIAEKKHSQMEPMHVEDTASFLVEVLTKCEFEMMSPMLQEMFRSYFDRYDLNGNQIVDSENELKQLVTNINFQFKLPVEHISFLNDQPQVYAAANPGFTQTLEQFVLWYCQTVQARINSQTWNAA